MPKQPVTDLQKQAEKKQNRFLFCCVANILYIIPCLSCLAMGILLDGFSFPFGLAIAIMLLNLPVSLVILHCYTHKQRRALAVTLAGVMLALHLVSVSFLGTWYILLAPSFVLYALTIAWSKIIDEH